MKKIDDLSYVLDVLQSELKRRFIKYTAPGTANHNPVIHCLAYLLVQYVIYPCLISASGAHFLNCWGVYQWQT